MTEGDISELRDKIARCRRLLATAVDPATQDTLRTYLAELEQELEAREVDSK